MIRGQVIDCGTLGLREIFLCNTLCVLRGKKHLKLNYPTSSSRHKVLQSQSHKIFPTHPLYL